MRKGYRYYICLYLKASFISLSQKLIHWQWPPRPWASSLPLKPVPLGTPGSSSTLGTISLWDIGQWFSAFLQIQSTSCLPSDFCTLSLFSKAFLASRLGLHPASIILPCLQPHTLFSMPPATILHAIESGWVFWKIFGGMFYFVQFTVCVLSISLQ